MKHLILTLLTFLSITVFAESIINKDVGEIKKEDVKIELSENLSKNLSLTLSTDSKLKLVGGTNIILGDFPFVVVIYSTVNGVTNLQCGGAIISPFWILTSASCFQPSQFASDYFINAGAVTNVFGTTYTGSRIIIHHGVNSTLFGTNDIALLEVRGPIAFTSAIQPIRLPHPFYIPTGFGVAFGYDGIVGTNTNLQAVALNILPLGRCGQTNGLNSNHLICAGSSTPVGGSCWADWGFPFVTVARGSFILAGITSRNIPDFANCPTTTAALYTSVSPYRFWIYFHTGL